MSRGKVVFIKKDLIPPSSPTNTQKTVEHMSDNELSSRWEVLANELIAWKFPYTTEWEELNSVNREIKRRIFKDYPL